MAEFQALIKQFPEFIEIAFARQGQINYEGEKMMKKKKILLWYDVEDYVTEEAENALLKLLELMHEYGVRATLKLCTKKYEQLIHNGRTDILELLADHELAFHMTNHSVHPINCRLLSRQGFAPHHFLPCTDGGLPSYKADLLPLPDGSE